MNEPPPSADRAEARLLALLTELGQEEPTAEQPPTDRILRSVRWERALRAAAQTMGGIALAISDGLGLFLGRADHRPGR